METHLQTLSVGAGQKHELIFSVKLEFTKIVHDTRDGLNNFISRCVSKHVL